MIYIDEVWFEFFENLLSAATMSAYSDLIDLLCFVLAIITLWLVLISPLFYIITFWKRLLKRRKI